MKYIATFDLGGTDIKYGVIDAVRNELIYKSSYPTPNQEGGLVIVNSIINKIFELQKTYSFDGVALSSGGVIDIYKGTVINATNTIPHFIGLRIKELIEEATSLYTTVENDVNCFALAESTAHPMIKNFVLITLGTGIGGSIVIDGKVYRGAFFAGGEVGRIYVGNQPWEETTSVKSLVNIARSNSVHVHNGIELFDLYDKKENLVVNFLVEQWYSRLAMGISNLIYLFNPEMVAIGGAISNRPSLLNELMPFLKATCNPTFLSNTKIVTASFKNDGGLWGAFYHHKSMKKTS